LLQPELPIAFGLVALTAFAALWARRWHLPQAVLLVVLGLALSFAP